MARRERDEAVKVGSTSAIWLPLGKRWVVVDGAPERIDLDRMHSTAKVCAGCGWKICLHELTEVSEPPKDLSALPVVDRAGGNFFCDAHCAQKGATLTARKLPISSIHGAATA